MKSPTLVRNPRTLADTTVRPGVRCLLSRLASVRLAIVVAGRDGLVSVLARRDVPGKVLSWLCLLLPAGALEGDLEGLLRKDRLLLAPIFR